MHRLLEKPHQNFPFQNLTKEDLTYFLSTVKWLQALKQKIPISLQMHKT